MSTTPSRPTPIRGLTQIVPTPSWLGRRDTRSLAFRSSDGRPDRGPNVVENDGCTPHDDNEGSGTEEMCRFSGSRCPTKWQHRGDGRNQGQRYRRANVHSQIGVAHAEHLTSHETSGSKGGSDPRHPAQQQNPRRILEKEIHDLERRCTECGTYDDLSRPRDNVPVDAAEEADGAQRQRDPAHGYGRGGE